MDEDKQKTGDELMMVVLCKDVKQFKAELKKARIGFTSTKRT